MQADRYVNNHSDFNQPIGQPHLSSPMPHLGDIYLSCRAQCDVTYSEKQPLTCQSIAGICVLHTLTS